MSAAGRQVVFASAARIGAGIQCQPVATRPLRRCRGAMPSRPTDPSAPQPPLSPPTGSSSAGRLLAVPVILVIPVRAQLDQIVRAAPDEDAVLDEE